MGKQNEKRENRPAARSNEPLTSRKIENAVMFGIFKAIVFGIAALIVIDRIATYLINTYRG